MLNAFRIILITFLFLSLPAHAQDKAELNIIFVGNSYTYFNDMPEQLEIMMNNNQSSPFRANIEQVVKGGAHFKDHYNDGQLKRLLNNGTKWDYVVLQNQSDWAVYNEHTLGIGYKYAKLLAEEIINAGARPLLFVTWPKELGSQHYEPHGYIKSFGFQYKSNNYHYAELGKRIGAKPIPVNDYWVKTLQNYSGIKLYSDGSHPTPAGSYLIALVFYKYFTGKPLNNPKLFPRGLKPKTVQTLQYVVAQPLDDKK